MVQRCIIIRNVFCGCGKTCIYSVDVMMTVVATRTEEREEKAYHDEAELN